MFLSELRRRFSAGAARRVVLALDSEEGVVTDSRSDLRPKDCIEQKLRVLLSTNARSRKENNASNRARFRAR